jgi:hypothetical protein
MRVIWTVVVALVLAAASAARPPRIEVRGDRHAQQLVHAPEAMPAVALRRRAIPAPDGFTTHRATPIAPFTLAPPRITRALATAPAVARPTAPHVLPRSSRGPPPG